MLRKISRHFGVILLCLTLILIYHQWFFSSGIFSWGDWWWFYRETVWPWLSLPQVWVYSSTGGLDIGLSQYLPVRLFPGILTRIMEFKWSDRLVFLIPSVILPALSSYYLSYRIFKNTKAAVVSATIYSLNTYMLGLRTGHFTLAVAFALAPLIVSLFIESVSEINFKKGLLCGLASALSFSYEPRAFILIAMILGTFTLYHLLINSRRQNLRQTFVILLYSALPILVTIMLNLYGIVSLSIASGKIYDQVLNRSLFGSGAVSVQRGFTLSLNEFHDIFDWKNTTINAYFWAIPLLSFLGLWVGRKNRLIVFYGLISLAGIFLLKQANQPFGFIYVWLFNHIPGFDIYRETSKFYSVIALGYMVLIGNLVVFINSRYKFQPLKIKIYLSTIFILFLLNAIPVIQQKFGNLLKPRSIPPDYLVYKQFLFNNYGSYRTLFVPAVSRWGYWDPNIRLVSDISYVLYDWSKLANYHKEGLEYSYIDHAMSILEKSYSANILNQHAVRYVVIPPEDKANDEIFIYNWGPRPEYVDRVSHLSYLKPIDIGTNELLVYENKSYRPIIYWTNEPEQLNVDQSYGLIDTSRKNSTEYTLLIKSIPKSQNHLVINFSESYHPGWKIRVGDFNWLSALTDHQYFLPTQPEKSDIETNYFVINPEQIKSKYPQAVVSNSQSDTYDLQLHLYFYPQSFVNIATYISILSGAIVTTLTLFLFIKNKK